MEVSLKLERKAGDAKDKTFIFPVLPEELEIKGDSGNETVETIQKGEVTVFGERKLRTFEIAGFFTANENAPFCRTKGEDFRTPEECVAWIGRLQEAGEPVWFIPEGLGIDAFWVTVESFAWKYIPGHDIEYVAGFREYRPFGQRAKTLNRAPDIFGTGERKTYESTGERREPTGWAIGDRVIVSGMYYRSPNGLPAPLGDIAAMPADFMTRPWSLPLELTYRAMADRPEPLKAQRAIIIDIIRTREERSPIDGVPHTVARSKYGYCIADLATQERIGWVAEDQLTRV